MTPNSIFLTNSGINPFSGGGIVGMNYVESLKAVSTLQYILCGTKFSDDKYNGIPAYTINARDWGYVNWRTTPFFEDYMAFHLLQKQPKIDLVMTYGCPFGLTIEEAKREFSSKIVCDLAPHIIEITKEDHLKYVGSYDYPHLVDDVLWGLYSRHLKFADAVVVHSHKSAEYIEKKANLTTTPHVIPHGCNLPEQSFEIPDIFTPGYFGAIGIDKGVMYLANAWLNLPYAESQLVIGGREGEGFKIEDKYTSRFKILGFVENLVDFYKQISVYIQPSITEGFGITPLEAMAYGRPVIVAEGAGMSELVTDGFDGFVVPIRDIKAIVDKIGYFHDNPSEIQRMGKNAHETAKKYTWDIIQKRYTKLFEELL